MYNTLIDISRRYVHINTLALSESIKDYYRLLMASKTEKNVKQKNRYDAVLLYMEGYPENRLPRYSIFLETLTYNNSLIEEKISNFEKYHGKKLDMGKDITTSLYSFFDG